ncbi:MAG: hypothetical protein Q9M19_06310 [Mariprofundaceae bacterium]|nr:hypothetical protein [Mariprofundaceae bacterium]
MNTLALLSYALLGLIVNMSFSAGFAQADWCLAILLAALLSYRQNWLWVLPCICLHDLVLYHSIGVAFPYFIAITFIITYTDQRLGQSQHQRWLALFVGCFPLWMAGVGIWNCVLTLTLSVMIWSFLSYRREKAYVEPA